MLQRRRGTGNALILAAAEENWGEKKDRAFATTTAHACRRVVGDRAQFFLWA
jgi:hypothetical protein